MFTTGSCREDPFIPLFIFLVKHLHEFFFNLFLFCFGKMTAGGKSSRSDNHQPCQKQAKHQICLRIVKIDLGKHLFRLHFWASDTEHRK